MSSNNLSDSLIWPVKYSRIAIIFSIILILSIYMFFGSYIMPLSLLLFGFCIIGFFFLALHYYSLKWSRIDSKTFYKKLFWHSFVYRLIFVGIMYLLTLWLDPKSFPFEINAADSWLYHNVGIKISNNISNGQFIKILESTWRSVNDYGHSLYIGILYYIFGPHTFVVRFFNVVFGSITVVCVAKISRDIFNESAGRLAGILAMLMPAFLWYGGTHLKETVMIFIIITVCYNATRLITTGKFKLINIAVIIIFSFLLFYYRGFLAPLLILSVSAYFMMNLLKKKGNKPVLIISTIIFLVIIGRLISSFGYFSEIQSTLNQAEGRFDTQMEESQRQMKEISIDKVAVSPLILAGAVITPFPSLLDFERRQLGMYVRYQNDMVRNIMYFFVFLGLFYSIRKKLNESLLILTFGFGYIAVLAISGVSFQARFQLPSLPFMIILISGGFCYTGPRLKKYWPIYLIFIFIAIFAWNYFKMSIRGLV